MIEQLLNQEFVLAVSAGIRAHAEAAVAARDADQTRGREPLAGIDSDDLTAFSAALAAAEDGVAAPLPQAGVVPKDDLAYIPHDPLLSIVQSAVEEATVERRPEAIQAPRRSAEPGRRGGRAPAVTDERLRAVRRKQVGADRRAWGRMEVAKGRWIWLSDPRWAVCKAVEMWREHGGGYAEFVERPPVVGIADDARVFLLGDWGSGLPRARKVGQRVAEELQNGGRRQQLVIHLGDVYYSGTRREFERRFLARWPVADRRQALSFALPGNHDMYSGGHAFYGTCLADPRFERQQRCSYFALENEHWQLLGLDSAYEDGGLQGGQAEWARQRISEGPAQRKTILLSHHQLFSSHEGGAEKLARKIEPVLATERVDAWFWGHEHRCIQYAETRFEGRHRVGFASCVGHAGIPEYLVMKEGETRDRPWAYEYLRRNGTGLEPWGTFGFAILELEGAEGSVRYIDEDGREHHRVRSIAGGSR